MNKNASLKYLATFLKLTGGFPLRNLYAGIGSILMMHRVVPDEKKDRIWANSHLEITPEHLEEAVKYYIKHNYQIIGLDELYHILTQGKKVKKRLVVFTFDDGYKDNLTYAYPVFQKYKVPFTIYVITDFPNHKSILWWNVLEKEVLEKSKLSFSWYGKKMEYDCISYEEKIHAFNGIHSLIQNGKEDDLETRAVKFCELTGNNPYGMVQQLALSWEEIRHLSNDDLVTIGAHTISHPVLKNLPMEKSYEEIRACKEILQRQTNKAVEHIAYPFGGKEHAFTREYEYADEQGFKTGTTSVSATIFKKHKENLLHLPRIEYGSTMNNYTLDLNRYGLLNFIRNKGKRIN